MWRTVRRGDKATSHSHPASIHINVSTHIITIKSSNWQPLQSVFLVILGGETLPFSSTCLNMCVRATELCILCDGPCWGVSKLVLSEINCWVSESCMRAITINPTNSLWTCKHIHVQKEHKNRTMSVQRFDSCTLDTHCYCRYALAVTRMSLWKSHIYISTKILKMRVVNISSFAQFERLRTCRELMLVNDVMLRTRRALSL